jgi:hypothetical protein
MNYFLAFIILKQNSLFQNFTHARIPLFFKNQFFPLIKIYSV